MVEAATLSKILERVLRKTITLKQAGESYADLPGLSRTIPRAFWIDGGGKQCVRRGSRREGSREGFMQWRFFQIEYGMLSSSGAEV